MQRRPIMGDTQDRDPGTAKKRRLNRPFTACETCRKLKTRCEIIAAKKACRRCTSLGIECDLPSVDEAFPADDMTSLSDVNVRLARIEDSIEELSCLIRGAGDHSSSQAAGGATTRLHRETRTPSMAASVESSEKPTNGVTRPVLLLRNLQNRFFGPKRDFSDEVLALGSVVSAGIIRLSLAKRLIQIFVTHYGCWISVKNISDLPADLEHHHPLLFSTACLLAARFVPSIGKAVGHDMYLMVRRLAASVVLKPPPLQYEEIQGLLLLSMFSPTIQTAMPIDSWLMSALAINHATLYLNISGNMLTEPDPSIPLQRLRIWNALCLTHMQFSIGNGRQWMVQQKFIDHCYEIVDIPNSSFEDARLSAEVLLYWKTGHLLNRGHQLQEGENLVFDELVEWKSYWDELFGNPHSTTLRFSYLFCYLLLYRVSLRAQSSSEILKDAALKTSREILNLFQDLEFTKILDLPDYYFFITIYAALTLCKFTIADPLITTTQESLMDLAPNDEHIAFRFGTVLDQIRQKAAAAGTLTDQLDGVPDVDAVTLNDHYAWDVLMAGFYPLNMDIPGLDQSGLSLNGN